MRKDIYIALGIYAAALVIMLYYNLTHSPVNDGVKEYETYLLNIEHGWMYRRTLVNSCLMTTWLPAMIQRYTAGADPMLLFRVWPTPFYALMPVFTYLIARRYLAVGYSAVAALVVLANAHIIFFPDIGRVGAGIAFAAGMVWALLERKWKLAMVFAVLVVFTHYGTALICTGLTAACFLGRWLWKKQALKPYLVVFTTLFVLTSVWHFWISSYSGWVMLTYGVQTDIPSMTGDIYGPETGWNVDTFLDARSREPAVQNALGLNPMSAPETIEVVSYWAMVGTITLGVFLLLKRWMTEFAFRIMVGSLWLLIVLTVAVPWLSVFYGGLRVFFTALPVLATAFPIGAEKIAQAAHVPTWVVCGVILVAFALSASGIIYLPFGAEKTFPVYWSLE